MDSGVGITLILAVVFFSVGLQQEKTNEKIKALEKAVARRDTVHVMGKADSLTLRSWVDRKAMPDSLKGKL